MRMAVAIAAIALGVAWLVAAPLALPAVVAAICFLVGALIIRASKQTSPDAQQALRIIASMPAWTWSSSPDGRITFVSDSMMRYLGRDARGPGLFHRLDNAGWRGAIHPDDYPRVMAARHASLQTGQPFDVETRVRGRDGVDRWFWCFGSQSKDAHGKVAGWYGTMIDIEAKKRAEEALRDRERELTQLVDLVPVHIRRLTPEGNPTYFNKRLRDFYGFDVSAIDDSAGASRLASAMRTLVHPDEADVLLERVRQSVITGNGYAMKYRLRRSDGVYRWVDGRAEPVRDASGAITQWYAISIDIDDEMRAEKAIRDSERALRQLVETLPAMIDCAAPDGEPIYRSRQLCEFLGYDLAALDESDNRLAATLDAGVHPDDLDGVKTRYAQSLATGEPYARRHRLRRHDGVYRWVETRAGAMRDSDGAIVQWNVICLDIDAEVKAQEELRLAQDRLARASQAASLAELSASIAHEVNQPLAAVVANSHACERWLDAEPPNLERARKTVARIIRDANGAADVVSRIRALFKPQMAVRHMTNLAGVLSEVRELLAEELMRRRTRLDVFIASDLPPLALDRVQIQQVLSNLIRNGAEAMAATSGDRSIRIEARKAEDAVQVAISDRGPGLAHPDKVFQPFFTTKPSGMGMGLAICRSIIESHGGRLWAESPVREGASFLFTLPLPARAVS